MRWRQFTKQEDEDVLWALCAAMLTTPMTDSTHARLTRLAEQWQASLKTSEQLADLLLQKESARI